jgi:diacylglycerol kinase (ATP)
VSRRYGGQTGRPNSFFRADDSGSKNQVERICLVANPRAGAGAVGRRADELRRAADRAFANWELCLTEGPGHASALARSAADRGFELVAAVGGDGTCNEVVNGLFEGDHVVHRKSVFTTIPFGTGSDLQKSLEVPRALAEALWIAATGITLPGDVGAVSLVRDGQPVTRKFINVAGFGANGEVVRRANESDKRMGGPLTFLSATVSTALSYQPLVTEVTWEGPDGPGRWEGRLMSAFVANGAYCGGGMWVGRGGSMHDRSFDLTLLPEASKARQVLDARHLYDGHLERFAGAVRKRVWVVRARNAGPVGLQVDLDGEMPGSLPVELRILPHALPMRGGWIKAPAVGD